MDYNKAEVLSGRIKAVSLSELVVVIAIVGILAALGFARYRATRERGLDKEAEANLRLIQAGERIHEMETGGYLACADETDIMIGLGILLPMGPDRNWNHATNASGDAVALRNDGGTRFWTLLIGDEDPACGGTCY